jgi:hypothetical protein
MFALILFTSVNEARSMYAFGHIVMIYVEDAYQLFRGSVSGLGASAMMGNVIVATSTNTHQDYDVNISWLPQGMELAAYFTIPLHARRYVYVGRFNMIQILFVLWSILTAAGCCWQEAYVYTNDYRGEVGVTLHMRHAMFPTYWMKRQVDNMQFPNAWGARFYACFWDLFVPPVCCRRWGLNFNDYTIEQICSLGGPTDWLWPYYSASLDRKMLVMSILLIYETVGTTIEVPHLFNRQLNDRRVRWQPAMIDSPV